MTKKPLVEKEKIRHEDTEFFEKGKISKEGNEFATYRHKCSKCGYDKAEIIDLGAQYSDENNLVLLRCGKCGWSERVSGKVS